MPALAWRCSLASARQIDEVGRDLVLDLTICRVRDTDPAGLGDAFETSSDVHPIAEDIIAFNKYVSEINAYAESHLPILWHMPVPLCQQLLNSESALHPGDNRGKLHQHAIASGLNDAPTLADYDR